VVETGQNLVEDAFDVFLVQVFVVSRLHQLIKVTIHILHGDVQFAGERVKEDVEGRDKVRMRGQRSQEDHFPQF
jgi:hypothetical protein